MKTMTSRDYIGAVVEELKESQVRARKRFTAKLKAAVKFLFESETENKYNLPENYRSRLYL